MCVCGWRWGERKEYGEPELERPVKQGLGPSAGDDEEISEDLDRGINTLA